MNNLNVDYGFLFEIIKNRLMIMDNPHGLQLEKNIIEIHQGKKEEISPILACFFDFLNNCGFVLMKSKDVYVSEYNKIEDFKMDDDSESVKSIEIFKNSKVRKYVRENYIHKYLEYEESVVMNGFKQYLAKNNKEELIKNVNFLALKFYLFDYVIFALKSLGISLYFRSKNVKIKLF